MTQFVSPNTPAGQYFTVAASQTSQVLGAVGATGDYLKGIIVVAATTTPGLVTVKDGTTAVISIPAGTATVLPYVTYVPVGAYSKTGAWNITTGASVSVFAVGQFT